MNARLGLLAATLLGLASLAGATGAGTQARTALDTSRVYDGTPQRAEPGPVYAGEPRNRPADPEAIAAEEQARARGRASLSVGEPIEPAVSAPPSKASWNPLLNSAKGGILMGVVGFVLGGPLGMLVGAAIGGGVAWGMTKVGDA